MQKHLCRITIEKLYGGYMAKFMFIKRYSSQKLDMLTAFFKYAGEIYDLLFINILVENDGEMSRSDTIVVNMSLCE